MVEIYGDYRHHTDDPCFILGQLTHTHTLDKNGSLYDPAGTESWNMQIRYETMQVRLHGSRGVSSVATDPPRDPGGPLHWI